MKYNIQDLQFFVNRFERLKTISKKLHKQDENACNYGLTDKQEKLVEKLETEAQEIAKELGFIFYHQGDPRGGTGYLIDNTMDDSNYYNGLFIA